MNINNLKSYITSLTSHVLFEYNGKKCGIDPLSRTEFDIWYGEKIQTVKSSDDVFSVPIFDGKSLKQIFGDIKNLDY